MQPVVETQRLRLRLPALEDAAAVAAHGGDPGCLSLRVVAAPPVARRRGIV